MDPILSGCFLPFFPACPLHRPVSVSSVLYLRTGSYCTAVLGALFGVPWRKIGQICLKMQAALVETSSARASLSLPRFCKGRERASLCPLPSFHDVEMVVRWKCWGSSLSLICNNGGNFSDSNAGVEVVDRGSLGKHL